MGRSSAAPLPERGERIFEEREESCGGEALNRWREEEEAAASWAGDARSRRAGAAPALCIGVGRGGSRCRAGRGAPDARLARGGGPCGRRECGRRVEWC